MRITLSIKEEKLARIIRLTGQKKKSPALAQALDEYLDNRERQEFLARIHSGKTDYAASNDEVEELSRFER